MLDSIAILLFIAVVSWVFSMYFLWRYNLQKIQLLKQLSLISTGKKTKDTVLNRVKNRLFIFADKLAPVGERFPILINEEQLERDIALAGYPQGLNVASFLGLRLFLVLVALLMGIFLSVLGFGIITQLILVLLGFFGPSWWISWTAKERQERIGLELPEFLDAMSVTLQAGTPMDPALKQIITSIEGPLSEELTRFMQELDLGVPREEAYKRMMNRNDCPELETLVLALIQGSKLGVPIANTFRVMAEDIRETRKGKIKEKAAKAGPKVTLITTFVILPGVMLCVVGLLILNFLYNPDGMGLSDFTF